MASTCTQTLQEFAALLRQRPELKKFVQQAVDVLKNVHFLAYYCKLEPHFTWFHMDSAAIQGP